LFSMYFQIKNSVGIIFIIITLMGKKTVGI